MVDADVHLGNLGAYYLPKVDDCIPDSRVSQMMEHHEIREANWLVPYHRVHLTLAIIPSKTGESSKGEPAAS